MGGEYRLGIVALEKVIDPALGSCYTLLEESDLTGWVVSPIFQLESIAPVVGRSNSRFF